MRKVIRTDPTRIVWDPDHGKNLDPGTELEVEWTQYWMRRMKEGVVQVVEREEEAGE